MNGYYINFRYINGVMYSYEKYPNNLLREND